MFTALFGFVVTIAGALLLFPRYGHAGVAAAVGCAGWASSLVLGVILRRRGWLSFDTGIARRILGIVAASIIMAAALLLCLYAQTQIATGVSLAITRLLTLIVLIPLGLAVYLFSLRLFGIVHIGELIAAARHRV
jgi:putative peptidoglycan lipid II flippase